MHIGTHILTAAVSVLQQMTANGPACVQIATAEGLVAGGCHLTWGLWLMGNIWYHYFKTARVSPGCTADVNLQVCSRPRKICAL